MIKEKIYQLLGQTQFRFLLDILSVVFNRTHNQDIRRSSKSLHHLILKEADDNIEQEDIKF